MNHDTKKALFESENHVLRAWSETDGFAFLVFVIIILIVIGITVELVNEIQRDLML